MNNGQVAATLGPACRDEVTLRQMIRSGACAFRMNFSQGQLADHAQSLAILRQAAAYEGVVVRVMGDLCGPRFRIAEMEPGEQVLTPGQDVTISPGVSPGTAACFGTNVDHICDDVIDGDRVFIDEGRIHLRVTEASSKAIRCCVERGGILSSYKGMNLPDTRISIPALTTYDWDCVQWAIANQVDTLLQSFIRTSEDVSLLRQGLQQRGGSQTIVAKIETLQATQHLAEIAAVSDELLIARGDLGAEIGLAQVPRVQKQITVQANKVDKPVILATHILHSMIDHPEPTRAEVSDVANAVLDGVNMFLLTGETAIGRYPVQTVQVLREIIQATTL